MSVFTILDADGNVVNESIKASAEWVAANFEFYRANVPPEEAVIPAEELARGWRDGELRTTDFIVPTTDHPQHAAYIAYRVALRSWPTTSSFPDTKPTLGE